MTPESAAFLVSTKPGYHGGFFRHVIRQILPNWLQLKEAVRTGRPAVAANHQGDGQQFFAEFVEGLFPLSYKAAQVLGEHLGIPKAKSPVSVLDIGAGSGVWGIALAHQSPHVTIHAVDWPAVLKVTRKLARRHGVEDRLRTVAGDLLEADFGAGHQVATIGHILHSEGRDRSRQLLRKTFRALAPGGTIVISEFMPDDDRTGPPAPLIFAVNMLLHTEAGDTFTFAEMADWLREAGFANPRLLEAPAPSPLIARHATLATGAQTRPSSLTCVRSSHSRARLRASAQRLRRCATSSGLLAGSKVRSGCQALPTSARSFQNPTARPARQAAPKAVVSATLGRTTGTCNRSAWNCMSRLLAEAPPSTRNSCTGMPESSCITSSTSATWKAMPSSAARAMWPAVVPRVRPVMVPRAYWSQWGAPSPANAGTRYTPPQSGTLAASASTSAGRFDQPQAIPQPLNDRAADEDAAFQRVIRLRARLPRDRGEQLVPGGHRLRPGVHQHETAGAVSVLGQAAT